MTYCNKNLIALLIVAMQSSLETEFLIRSYGTPNGTGRFPVAQCHNKIWATLAQQ